MIKLGDTYHVGMESDDIPRIAADDRTPREAVSRAYYKLREVATRTNVLKWANDVSESRICALDVGASPGGWSYFLSAKCKHVHAVDPAEMASPIPENVTHYQDKIENVVSKEIIKPNSIHLYVCDMNANPRVMITVFESATSLLVHGAVVVLTFKSFKDNGGESKKAFLEGGDDGKWKDPKKDEAAFDLLRVPMRIKMYSLLELLQREYIIPNTLQVLHLMSNGVQERTAVFQFRRSLSPSSS